MTKIHDIEVDDFVAESVQVDPLFIQEEFARLSTDLAYWNQLFAEAHRAFLLAKLNDDQVSAARWIVLREEISLSRGKSNLDDIRSALEVDDDVKEARAARIEAEYERERLKGVLDAVRSKRDMLISIGAHIRAEMAGDPTIREQHRMKSE